MKSISEFALEHESATRLLLKYDLGVCMEAVLKNTEISRLNKTKFVKILFPNYRLADIVRIVDLVSNGETFSAACHTIDEKSSKN